MGANCQMAQEEVQLLFIDKNREYKTIVKCIKDIKYVEELINNVLGDLGVKPPCRILFGLRLIESKIWLAPNELVRSFIGWTKKDQLDGNEGPKLELRMRFLSSCLTGMSVLDQAALDIIYAQIYVDFMRARIDTFRRDIIMDDGPLSLVALNLAMHCIEKNIDVEQVLTSVNPKNFVPKKERRWLAALLFHQASWTNLEDTLKKAYESSFNDTRRIKEQFIEMFLKKVAADYNYEVYHVHQSGRKGSLAKEEMRHELRKIRVRYHLYSGNVTCLIESAAIKIKRRKRDKGEEPWLKICSVDDINHVTLRGSRVQIVGPDTGFQLFKFHSVWYAKSFISCIDGYYRLMKRWNFNLCRELYSPELKYLSSIGCHGPMGLHTTRTKLLEFERPDCYLVRKSIDIQNRFLIDTFIDQVLLTIDVDWCPELKLFKQTHYSRSGRLRVSVRTGRPGYALLKSLINDLEIRYQADHLGSAMRVHQLKHLIHPSENDTCPVMMHFVCKRQSCDDDDPHQEKKRHQLPQVLPSSSMVLTAELLPFAPNGLQTYMAIVDDDRQVVTKKRGEPPINSLISNHTFHLCPAVQDHMDLVTTLDPSQLRLADWLFVKSTFFAETIGYALIGQLVQEYFPLGRLDLFLRADSKIGQIVLLSAAFQLTQALLFLAERHIIHGKIRCRNIMVKQLEPIQIKITDPLGAVDLVRDQAFIPIEYYNSQIDMCVRKYDSGIDVWATGTTIWQIFNHGLDPPSSQYANKLTQLKCPPGVWKLVEGCWIIERNFRTNPLMLHRDMFDLVAWEDGARNYLYIDCDDSKGNPVDQDNVSPTNTSSNSDLSTLYNVDSIVSSTNSTYSNNSKTALLKPDCRSKMILNQSYNTINGQTNHVTISNWAVSRMIIEKLKKCPKRNSLSGELTSDESMPFDKLIESFDTVSRSEATNLTDLMDTRSMIEEFDRCIWQVDSRRLKLGSEIGRGSSGIVIRGTLLKSDDEEEIVAVKRLDKDCRYSSGMGDLRREFDILKILDHKNIIKTLGYVDELQPMLIFEFMPLGSLLSCIRNMPSSSNLNSLPLRKYALDIASGMEYLESKKIVHRDLALRNILLNDRHEAKICDFGLAKCLDSNDSYRLETDRALPLKWYAPETLSTWVFTHKSDVWSYGVTLWEMFSSGDSPQYSGTYENLVETLKHERLPIPPSCPEDMYHLMLACWAYSPDDRDTFGQIRALLA